MTDYSPAGPAAKPAGGSALQELQVITGRARGYALNVGTLAVLCATAETAEERVAQAGELVRYREYYRDAMARAAKLASEQDDLADIKPQRRILRDFDNRIARLPDDGIGLSRAEAAEIAAEARDVILPAIYAILAFIQERENAVLAARTASVAERSVLLSGLTSEMGRIGRMIGIVSINASVEAARAGGDSGRAFEAIAGEVRNLARQSSELLDRLKRGLAEDAGVHRRR